MKKLITNIVYCFVLLISLNLNAKDFDKKEIENKIDALIPEQISDSTPGLVIGIVKKGELVFSKGYGLANISYGISNNPKMVYNIGSVSKQFLGYAFAMLHMNGSLNINDPVTKYLDDWPEFKHKVTLKHLLTHTSGYREAYTLSNLAGRFIGVDRLSRKECLDVVRNQPQLEFIPGSRYTYNSTAWVILAEVLEKVTKQPADKWVEQNILLPLKMKDTQIESFVGEVIRNAAESYSEDEDKGLINQDSNRSIFGAAEVYSSIEDMHKWINNLRTAEIGGKKVKDFFLKPFILNDGSNSEYALGIGISTYRGLKRYRHTGGHEAFVTQLSYYPDQDLGIITVSNYGGKGWLATSKIADLLLEEEMTPVADKALQAIEMTTDNLERFAGIYLANTINKTIELKMVDGTLVSGKNKLIPTNHNTFSIAGWNGEFQFESISDGKTQLTVGDARKKTYLKVDKWTPNKSKLSVYKGDYWSDELETVYHLIVKEKNLSIQHRWIGEIALEPVTIDIFKSEWGFYVKFNRNTKGDILSFSINSGRTLNVVFDRKE